VVVSRHVNTSTKNARNTSTGFQKYTAIGYRLVQNLQDMSGIIHEIYNMAETHGKACCRKRTRTEQFVHRILHEDCKTLDESCVEESFPYSPSSWQPKAYCYRFPVE
jgi:hypothetical protein